MTVLPESPQSRVSESLAEMEPCPRCQLSDRVRRKLVLINPWDEAHAAAHPHWRVTCACQGDLTVDSLRPEFISQGPSAQFIQALYCERCCVGFVPDYMAKPAPPRYQGGREGFRRVFPDGTVGPLLTRIADDPDTGNVDFYLDSQVVGFFKNGTRPASDGIYAYEPYRSPGHLNVHNQLRSAKTPRCSYESDSQRVSFSVIANPSAGVLSLAGFDSAASPLRRT